jgi:hypothetical protein
MVFPFSKTEGIAIVFPWQVNRSTITRLWGIKAGRYVWREMIMARALASQLKVRLNGLCKT